MYGQSKMIKQGSPPWLPDPCVPPTTSELQRTRKENDDTNNTSPDRSIPDDAMHIETKGNSPLFFPLC